MCLVLVISKWKLMEVGMVLLGGGVLIYPVIIKVNRTVLSKRNLDTQPCDSIRQMNIAEDM